MKATIIIPNFNGKTLIEECLNSLKKQTFKDFETLVVDNHSDDGSQELIKNKFPNVKIIELDKNHGFAKAINYGVKNSSTKYVVFLNNDTFVDKDWLKYLIEEIEKRPKVASVNSKIMNYFEKQKIDGIGISLNEVGQAISIGWGEKDSGQYENPFYIFGATGGASIFRREIFVKVGMFDENYFMYSEEVDWAFRAQFLGYKSLYCPKAIVYHKHKSTSRKKPQNLEYWQFKNMTQTIIKDMPLRVLLKRWRWLKILLVHLNTILYQLKNGFYWPPVMTEIWLLLNLPYLIVKRIQIQSNRKVSDEYIESFLTEKKITFWGLAK